MSEAPTSTQETPVAPATTTAAATEPTPATTTASEATADPVRTTETSDLLPESRPEIATGTQGTAEALPNLTNAPKEEKVGKNEVLVESHLINEGVLNYKGPGLK